MKRFTSLLLAVLPFFAACSSDDSTVAPAKQGEQLPSTEVFVQGQSLSYSQTRADESDSDEETARFFIRIDGRIPGYENQNPLLYFGQYNGDENVGKVSTLFPYGRYNDRDLDYYEVNKKTGLNTGLFRYVFDPEGIQTSRAISEEPQSIRAMLERELGIYQGDIAKGYKPEEAQEKVNILTETLNQLEDLHIIWYVVKEVGQQHGWHVDGVITTTDVTNVKEIPEIGDEIEKEQETSQFEETHFDADKVADNVEVDIHLQEHKDWNEIKTSVHIRTDAESVTINLPLPPEYIVEQDDFAVRIFNYYYKEFELTHEITHDEHGITISITGIDPTFIQQLKGKFGDGLTVEIHSYTTQLETIWEALKNSTVTTGKPCTLKGQITSAYAPEDIVPIE